MTDTRLPLALALSLLMAPAALAQTATAPETAPQGTTEQEPATPGTGGLSMGEEIVEGEQVGDTYVAGEFGDWQMTCVKSLLEADPCQLYQLMQDEQGNSIAEVVLFNLPQVQQQAVAGATFVTPLETHLPDQITLRVDAGQAKRYPFTFCAPVGCISRVGFTEAEINAFRRGNRATLVIVPAMAPGEQVAINMSLSGFTAGYAAVVEANEKALAAERAAIAAQQAEGQSND